MKTLEELKAMGFIPHHDCAICGETVGWHPQDPDPWFDTGCGCGCGGGGHYDSWENAFKWYNREYEKESMVAVNAAWELHKAAAPASIPISGHNGYASIRIDHVEIMAHVMPRILSIPAIRDAIESHKSSWIPGSKGGETNHR